MPARESPPRWSRGDSNPGPPPCKGGALPAKLRPPTAASRRSRVSASPLQPKRPDRVGAPGLEPGTSALSGPRSNRLSYAPAAGAHAPSSTAADRTRGPRGPVAPCPRRSARILPHTRSRKTARPGRVRSTQQPLTSQDARGAADLLAIRGAPARLYHRLATGEPRGSVPTDAGSPLGSLTRVSSLTTATPYK